MQPFGQLQRFFRSLIITGYLLLYFTYNGNSFIEMMKDGPEKKDTHIPLDLSFKHYRHAQEKYELIQ
jgi:hypothetical protein